MTTRLKAIETRYAGHRFRSRLEARWAVFFDTLGVRWEYEKEGFDLGAAGLYLPDFWLPEQECWIEIKGQPHFGRAARKEAELARRSQKHVFIFDHPEFDTPRFDRLARHGDGFRGAWGRVIVPEHWDDEDGGDFGATWNICADCGARGVGERICHAPFCVTHAGVKTECRSAHIELEWAYAKAREARFEHGETPGLRVRPPFPRPAMTAVRWRCEGCAMYLTEDTAWTSTPDRAWCQDCWRQEEKAAAEDARVAANKAAAAVAERRQSDPEDDENDGAETCMVCGEPVYDFEPGVPSNCCRVCWHSRLERPEDRPPGWR